MTRHQSQLKVSNLVMLSLGVAIGGAFFLGTAVPLHAAGPSIILVFLVGGVIDYFILLSLAEMTVADPCPGSFRTYAQEQFGPWLGFTVGWVYWAGMVLAMSSEATAAAIFIHTWWAGAPLSLTSIIIVLTVTALNLVGAEIFSRLETSLAAIKVAALIAFILTGGILLLPQLRASLATPVLSFLQQPFFSGGVKGLAGSFLIVMFTYAGMEVLGLAAPDTAHPERDIPRAITLSVSSLMILYLIVMIIILFLVPTRLISSGTSPLVMALNLRGITWAGTVFNFIMPTAIITTMLVAVFSLGRVAQALAREGHAPAWLREQPATRVPRRGILFSGAGMLAGVSLSYVLPQHVYLFLISSGGFSVLFTYLVIVASHYRFRQRHPALPAKGRFLPGYPISSLLTMAALAAIMLSMPLISGQGPGLATGLILTVSFLLLYHALAFYRRYRTSRQLMTGATGSAAKPLVADNPEQAEMPAISSQINDGK